MWISALIVAVYCSPVLNEIPIHNETVCVIMEAGASHFDDKRLTPICGYLRVKVRYARNLCSPVNEFDIPDPYTRISVIRSGGFYFSKKTRTIRATRNPTWNQWLEMGLHKFTGFEVQVWDDNIRIDKEISEPENIEVSLGNHSNIKHCISRCRDSFLYLDYELKPENKCDPNPCRNGGTCIDMCSRYICSCTSSYTGDQCQYRQGRLTFYARYGCNLPDKDGWFAGDSDPYMRFVAYDVYGKSYENRTSTDCNDNDPEWYEKIEFLIGTRPWKRFVVSVWDEDSGSDDRLSNSQTWCLHSNISISAYNVIHEAHSGFVVFDYHMVCV